MNRIEQGYMPNQGFHLLAVYRGKNAAEKHKLIIRAIEGPRSKLSLNHDSYFCDEEGLILRMVGRFRSRKIVSDLRHGIEKALS